jgi:hypothetical protein
MIDISLKKEINSYILWVGARYLQKLYSKSHNDSQGNAPLAKEQS